LQPLLFFDGNRGATSLSIFAILAISLFKCQEQIAPLGGEIGHHNIQDCGRKQGGGIVVEPARKNIHRILTLPEDSSATFT